MLAFILFSTIKKSFTLNSLEVVEIVFLLTCIIKHITILLFPLHFLNFTNWPDHRQQNHWISRSSSKSLQTSVKFTFNSARLNK